LAELMEVDVPRPSRPTWPDAEAYLAKFGDKVPERLRAQLEAAQKQRLAG
jgi:hypothetical protein